MTCPKCSTEHDPKLCQGHVIKDPITREPIPPRQCAKTPVKGSTVCRSHGAGKGSPAAAAAETRLQLAKARALATTMGAPVEVDPHTALLEELHRTAGAVQWLGAVVADLDRDAITWGRVKETHGTQLEKGTDNGTTYAVGTNAFVRLWQEERDRLVKVAKACHDAGIEERRVRIAESAGQQLAAVVRAVLDRLQLTDEQRTLALSVVPEEFRRLGDTVPGEVVERPAGGAA